MKNDRMGNEKSAKNQIQKKREKELHSTSEWVIEDPRGYVTEKIPNMARLIHDFTAFSKKKNTNWAIFEIDVTEALRKLREHKKQTGETISFTAFIISVFSRVIALHKNPMNAMTKRGKKLFIFNDVDVMTNIEREIHDGSRRAVSYTFRKANKKTLWELHSELREAQKVKKVTATSTKQKKGWISWVIKNLPNFPGFIRKILLTIMFNNPILKKNSMGTVNVTAVGMFGTGLGKMVHITPHAVSLGVGGMESIPYNIDGKIVNRDMLGLSLAIDNDIVNGGTATRFLHDFRQWLVNFCHDADWCFKSLENEE